MDEEYNVYEKNGLRVEWVELGEGYDGDYDENDPEDEELLRFDVYVRIHPDDDNPEWEYHGGFIADDGTKWSGVKDGSYCTRVPASTSEEHRLELLERIHIEIENSPEHPRKVDMQRMSWVSAEGLDTAPAV